MATAAATSLTKFQADVGELKARLDSIDPSSLNADELAFRAKFYQIYQAYADSVALWTLDREPAYAKEDGIPLYRAGEPLVPRAPQIVQLYGLELGPPQGTEQIRCVPDDSIGRLWEYAATEAKTWLFRVF